jgi:hypothetical protein
MASSNPFRFLGSGSLEQDSPLSVVAMKKEEQTSLVHDHRLGKRQRHAHKTGQALAQRVIPPLHMSRFPCFLSDYGMLLLGDHSPVCRPKVREAMSLAVVVWNSLPQALSRGSGILWIGATKVVRKGGS